MQLPELFKLKSPENLQNILAYSITIIMIGSAIGVGVTALAELLSH